MKPIKSSRVIRPIRVEGDVARVPLTRGLEAVIDASDVGLVEGFNWAALVTSSGHAYAYRAGRDGEPRAVLMHRHIMGAEPGFDIDHVDADGVNNRRANLRQCSHRENMANMVVTRRNRLGLKGAYKRGNRYRSSIEIQRKTIDLGSYDTAEEAAAAYRGASKLLFGGYAR